MKWSDRVNIKRMHFPLYKTQAMFGFLLLAAFLAVSPPPGAEGAFNDRPIVAVLAQEVGGGNFSLSYIPASYVKALEASGARVVPLFINQTESYYRSKMAYINGVVFPGGGADFTAKGGFGEAAGMIYTIAKEINEMGDGNQVFPVLGVCQGLEVIAYWAANGTNPLVGCNAHNMNLPLEFKPKYKYSRLYRHLTPELDELLRKENVTSNHHEFCLTEDRMREFGLDAQWRTLSTNVASDGLRFVSSLEHRVLPFAGVQFHPEKPAYEWSPAQGNPHDYRAILANRYFYDWLVNTAKMNRNTFPDQDTERSALIYNYPVRYTPDSYDLEYYYFGAETF